MKKLIIALALSVSINVLAGNSEVEVTKGMFIAGILHEKCTGKPPLPNETVRQVSALQDQGFDEADIKLGIMQAVIYAEGTYPGKTRPSKKDCKEATVIYQQSLKLIQ